MNAAQYIELILLGGLLGLLGQVVRVTVGLKKAHDTASEKGQPLSDVFQGGSLVISLLIGFTAGAIAIFVVDNVQLLTTAKAEVDVEQLSSQKELLFGLMAAGYAGTDFIEGFAKRLLPGRSTKPGVGSEMREPDSGLPAPQPPAIG